MTYSELTYVKFSSKIKENNQTQLQNRLVSRFGGGRGESPPPAFMGIVEALNKVRVQFPPQK